MKKLILFTTTLLAWSGPLMAQSQIWGATDNLFRNPASFEAPVDLGWKHEEVLNLNLSFTSSRDVVGQTDGTSQTYGTNSRLGLYRFSKDDEWRNDLFLRESTLRSTSLPRFVKSDDEVKLSTIYLFYLPNDPQVGPYLRGEAAAPIFKGEDVHNDIKHYRAKNLTGPDETFSDTSTRLTDPLRPMTTREALGFFYRPYSEDRLRLELRLGFAGQQIRARGSYTNKGANPAGELVLQELADVSQAGLEAAAAVKGKVNDNSSYEVGIDSLTPFINNKPGGDRRDAWALTNVDAFAKLSSRITRWASFSYDYKFKLEPQLISRPQQIHMVVINLNFPTGTGKL